MPITFQGQKILDNAAEYVKHLTAIAGEPPCVTMTVASSGGRICRTFEVPIQFDGQHAFIDLSDFEFFEGDRVKIAIGRTGATP